MYYDDYHSEYYQKNKETILAKSKEYQKNYRISNKIKLKNYFKEYYRNNKEKYNKGKHYNTTQEKTKRIEKANQLLKEKAEAFKQQLIQNTFIN
jgi:hypothetical protein